MQYTGKIVGWHHLPFGPSQKPLLESVLVLVVELSQKTAFAQLQSNKTVLRRFPR